MVVIPATLYVEVAHQGFYHPHMQAISDSATFMVSQSE
jgi:hypothetical protein